MLLPARWRRGGRSCPAGRDALSRPTLRIRAGPHPGKVPVTQPASNGCSGASFPLQVAPVEGRLSDRMADVQLRGNASSVPRSDRRRSAGLLHPSPTANSWRFPGKRDNAATASLPRAIALSPFASPGYLSGSKGTSILHTWRVGRMGQGLARAGELSAKSRNIRQRSRLAVLCGSRALGLRPSGS